MAIEATARWSDKQTTTSVDTKTDQLSWDVVGTLNEEQAKFAPGVPPVGGDHPRNGNLIATSVTAKSNGFNAWITTVTFGPKNQGLTVSDDPLLQPAKFKWTLACTSEPVDRDIDGNPITTSSREAPDNPPQKEFYDLILTITKNETTYDLNKFITYAGTANSDSFTVGGKIVGDGLCRFLPYLPTTELQLNPAPKYVTNQYVLSFRADGWKLRFLDAGNRQALLSDGISSAFTNGPKYKEILDPRTHAAFSNPQLLDGKGALPGSPDGGGFGTPPGAEIDDKVSGVVFLKWKIYTPVPYGPLLNGLV